MEKKDLRKYAKEVRRTLEIDKISSAILLNIKAMPEFKRAKNVLLYYPVAYEINLLELCAGSKNFYLPRVSGGELLVCPYDCNVRLEKSSFNILEPCSKPVSPDIIDFAIIPCLMADRQKFRLGYGGGFYDRFLPSLSPDCVKIAPVAAELLVEKLPVEGFDIPVDFVVTQNEIF